MKHIKNFSITIIILIAIFIVSFFVTLMCEGPLLFFETVGWIHMFFVCICPFLMYSAVRDKYDSSSSRYMKSVIPYIAVMSAEILLFYLALAFFFGGFPYAGELIIEFFPLLLPPIALSVFLGYIISWRYCNGRKDIVSTLVKYFSSHPFGFQGIVFVLGLILFFLIGNMEIIHLWAMGTPTEIIAISFVTFLISGAGYFAIRKANKKLIFAAKYFSVFAITILLLATVYVFVIYKYPNVTYCFSNIGIYHTKTLGRAIFWGARLFLVEPLISVGLSLLLGALSGRKREMKQNEI